MKRRREGLARYTNLNGTAVYTAWTFTRHGWGVGFATPSAPVDNAFWHHLGLFGFLWAAAVGAGVLYAFAKARPVATALESLEDQAEHIATGQRIESLPDSSVEEVNRAIAALEKASDLLQTATRERDRSLETERDARAQAEAASHAKDEFLAMLSHELRNPLAAIWTAAAIVKSEGRSTEQLEFAARVIDRQTRHLSRLLDDLLDVGRAMTGKIALERAPVELAASARHVVEMLQTTRRLADRHVEHNAVPVWVEGDQTRIEQILTNLLVNAATYTATGGRIRVRIAREGAQALLEVSDDGHGIAPESLPRVFDLFFQAESTADRSAGGLGIGLTLVQRLVKLHGGDVTAHSKGRGTGATFTVRLPAVPEPTHAECGADRELKVAL
jgi:signal transduction histidine kinase